MTKLSRAVRITAVKSVHRRKSMDGTSEHIPLESTGISLGRTQSSISPTQFRVERIRRDSLDRAIEHSQLHSASPLQPHPETSRVPSSNHSNQIDLRFPSVNFLISNNARGRVLSCVSFRQRPQDRRTLMGDQRRNVGKSEISIK